MFTADDEDDFVPGANSKLATLFDRPMEGGNTSLTYTAPKQPKRNQAEVPASMSNSNTTNLNIIIVKAVQTFKLEDGKYNAKGKFGAAVLGNIISKSYHLLIYKNKQQHISTTKLNAKCHFNVQTRNFASFYDDLGQNWSLKFDSERDLIDFAREVGLAIANAQPQQEDKHFYMQDLKVGDGTTCGLGDLLEIRYTTLPLFNGIIGKPIESNLDADKPQRVKIRKGVWEEALLGAMRGGKRQIILEPNLFGPWNPLADADSRLVVEVDIGRVKTNRKSAGAAVVSGTAELPDSSESNVDSSTDETSIKARGVSISEALTNSPKTHKASIISRMARMGQPTLPLKGAVVCNPSDSEETEEEPVTSRPKASACAVKSAQKCQVATSTNKSQSDSLVGRKQLQTHTAAAGEGSGSRIVYNPALPNQMAVIQQPVGWPQQQQQQQQQQQLPQQYFIGGVPVTLPLHVDSQLYAPHQVVALPPMATTPGTPEPQMAVYISENRTHNAEVRMGLTKVLDKVDQVLVKLEEPRQLYPVGMLEPAAVLASIQKLVTDNEQLQAELADKRMKIEQQNDKIYQLLHQKFLEQSNTNQVDQRQDLTLQAAMLTWQQEKAKLTADLGEAVNKANSMQIQVSEFERVSRDLSEEVKNLTARLQIQHAELERSKQTIIEQENMMRTLSERNQVSSQLHQTQEHTILNLKANLKELQATKSLLEATVLEARHQLGLATKTASEQLSLMATVHKEEVNRLQKMIREGSNENSLCKPEDVENEVKKYKEMVEILQTQNEELSKKISSLEAQSSSEMTTMDENTAVIEGVKKIMNVVFRMLKGEFLPGSNYEGENIRGIILSTVQDVTLHYVNMKTKSSEAGGNVTEPNCSGIEAKDAIPSEMLKGNKQSHESIGETSKDSTPEPGESAQESVSSSGNPCSMKESIDPQEEKQPDELVGGGRDNVQTEIKESDQKGKQARDISPDRSWRPQPPPTPLFDDDDDEDDWLS